MPAIRAKILQISDLHFGTKIDPKLKSQLRNIVVEVQPHILIASGDLVDAPKKKYRDEAKGFLDDLKNAVTVQGFEQIVVPGNHDYKGILGSIEFRTKARQLFDQEFLKPEQWSNGLLFRERADLGIVITGFNSNPPRFEWNAAGKVEGDALQELENRFPDAAALGEGSPLFRIAVIHHHPMPIVFVATDRRARFEERNMVLYNAGTFLWTLNRKGFHLVLHGHKHFASFQRAGHEFSDRGRRELVVAGAGSALHPEPDDPNGNHIQVIYVYEDGTAELDSWFFSAEVRQKEGVSRRYPVLGLAEVGRRRRRAFGGRTHLAVGELRSEIQITEDGYSTFEDQLRHCRVLEGGERDDYPVDLDVPGRAYWRRAELVRIDGTPPLARLEDDPAGSSLRKYGGRIVFGRTWAASDPAFSLAYRYRLMNAHALSRFEFQRKYKDEKYEYASLPCYEPADALTLAVEFPKGCPVALLKVDVAALYKPGPMNRIDDYEMDDLQPHPEETERVRRRLFRENSRLVLQCCDPVPGYVYQVRWTFSDQDLRPNLDWDQVNYWEEKKQRLLEIAGRAAGRELSASGVYAQVHRTLESVEDEIRRKLQAGPDKIDLSLMVFDEKEKALRVVGANFGDIQDLWRIQFGSGEGCAGFVFEKNRPLFYAPALTESADLYISPAEHKREEGETAFTDYKYLSSMPWRHPSGLLAGVICVGSRTTRPPGDPVFGPETDKVQKLWDLLLPHANGILEAM